MATTGEALDDAYRAVRARTEGLVAPLSAEDCQAQSMPDASPAKWHLAHSSWFFETFVLGDEPPFDPAFGFLFNSYYDTVGERHPRPERGLLTRPSLARVLDFRHAVDGRVLASLARGDADPALVRLGLEHEQQHQELLLMDLKHLLSRNALRPAYRDDLAEAPPAPDGPSGWVPRSGGLVEIGHEGEGFAFDNETPRHCVHLEPHRLATRLTTCGEWLAFMEDGGYETPQLWMADGWTLVQRERWRAPLYWEARDGDWSLFTLGGMRGVRSDEPVCHLSWYEADAFARWAGARLPTEAEWEHAAVDRPVSGVFLEGDCLHPQPAPSGPGLRQLHGDLWEWTSSAYSSYPRYRPLEGAVGEYNGKFMSGQFVLRGGCHATPAAHARATYRNFYYPHQRWMFSGLRLAADS